MVSRTRRSTSTRRWRRATKWVAPGVPDLYRGDELWFSALVDPDNRRLVDWAARDLALRDVARPTATTTLAVWRDKLDAGHLKMLVAAKMLLFGRVTGLLMSSLKCESLSASGGHRDSAFAFRRSSVEQDLIILAPRLTRRLAGTPVGEAWGDTGVVLPSGSPTAWQTLIDGQRHDTTGGQLRLANVFSVPPVGALADISG
jgi:(1->4)-alpha-D-glucan 1-alpha-D-glucosylmutase